MVFPTGAAKAIAKFEEHCLESIRLFGEPYAEVQRWLDEFAGTARYGMRHRRVRHHEAGVREAARRFGAAAGTAARQHVLNDLKGEGWTERDPFPRDEAHYVAMGLF